MNESQLSVVRFADEKFGPAPNIARIAARANEEMAELLRKVTSEAPTEEIIEEAADVLIILYRLAEVCGHDLHQAVDRKMIINRARTWRKDGTGHGYHVRDKEPHAQPHREGNGG